MGTNITAGTGSHSHELPTVPLHSVLMRDQSHQGTIITLLDDSDPSWLFSSLDLQESLTAERIVLIQLAKPMNTHSLGWPVEPYYPYATDLDTPDGIILLGIDLDEEIPYYGTVLYDSQFPPITKEKT